MSFGLNPSNRPVSNLGFDGPPAARRIPTGMNTPQQPAAPGAPTQSAQPPMGSVGQGDHFIPRDQTGNPVRTSPISVYQPPGQTVQQLPPGTATQPGNVAATAPLPYQTFGGIAQVDPAFASPFDQQGYYQQYSQMLQQSMDPYFQQQQQQLNSDLRARGIQNSGAAGYLEGNLLGQQGATLAGQEAPFVQQAYGYANQDVMANQNAANEAALYNANAYQGGVNRNYDAYNNYLQQLLGLGGADYGSLQAAYLNSFGPSTGVQSGYNNALAGTQNVYGSVYGNALNAQTAQMQNLGMMAGMGG